MPQIFQVLKCYKCSVFQIHQTKKSNKFECKVCGEKQSIKRHYGIGTGKDCRMHVQKLNVLRGNMDIKVASKVDSDEEYEDYEAKNEIKENINNNSETIPKKRSKWSPFIDEAKEIEVTEEPMFLGDKEVFLELPRKTKTSKVKVKQNSNNSDEYLPSIKSNCKSELKSSLKFSNENNVDDFESKVRPVHATESKHRTIICQEIFSNNVNNVVTEKSLTKPAVLLAVNKNSRWAQYVNAEDDADLQSDVLQNHDSNSDNLFSLCDDNDLDEVLDI